MRMIGNNKLLTNSSRAERNDFKIQVHVQKINQSNVTAKFYLIPKLFTASLGILMTYHDRLPVRLFRFCGPVQADE